MALAFNPDLIIADEPTTALDVIIQDQVMQNIYELQEKLNKSMLLITHDIAIVAKGCNKIAVMYAGKLMEYRGSSERSSIPPVIPTQSDCETPFPACWDPERPHLHPGIPPQPYRPLARVQVLQQMPLPYPAM